MEIVEILGWIFAAILAVTALLGVFVGLHSIPDARRYFRIRRM